MRNRRTRATRPMQRQRRSGPEAEACSNAAAPPARCPVVVLGASAGGLELFQKFFRLMPPDTGMAFVLVQHSDPTHETLIPELLSKHTSMPVQKAAHGMPLDANHVYVVPPQTIMGATSCAFRVQTRKRSRAEDRPIDRFFEAVAEDQGEMVVGIILSGIGGDGTAGLKAIKERGGLTMAQSPETARYDSMPRTAILSGYVDHVLPVEEMPSKVLEYIQHLRRLGSESPKYENAPESRQFKSALSILAQKTGHDFSRYKESTLQRRIQRRMRIVYASSLAEYVKLLRRDNEEVNCLFKDLLIGVTQFFRDTEAFEILKTRIIPALFEDKKRDDTVRIWVPGCATGEEAFSIAILMAEFQRLRRLKRRIQIFGTDLDQAALETARRGMYAAEIEEQVAAPLRSRYFIRRGEQYEVTPEIRELCLFSPHNLIKDPPFSRLDLISCRNVLIYFDTALQRLLLPIFHYALNPSGYLFLGPSENVAARSELFSCIDKKCRMFQRRPTLLRTSMQMPVADQSRISQIASHLAQISAPAKEQNIGRVLEHVILEEFAPPSAVITETGEVLYFCGKTSKFIELPPGAPTNRILTLVRRDLRLELRKALHRAVQSGEEVVRGPLTIRRGRKVESFNLVVRPVTELGREPALLMVVFRELDSSAQKAAPGARRPGEEDTPLIRQLEDELRTTRDDLQATIEELESSNEELKSANEELLSMNEDLQSTNEELQTSKEELQSVNDELAHKIEELDTAHSDLQNLLEATQLATVFLGPEGKLKRFTAPVTDLAPLTPQHLGQPFDQAAPVLATPEVMADVAGVLKTLTPRDRELSLAGGQTWYMVRILPYRNLGREVEGVVLTFANITELKRAQTQRAQLAAIVEGSRDAILSKTLEGIVTSWNAAAERMYGYSAQEAIGQHISFIVPPERRRELAEIFARILAGEPVNWFETVRVRKDGQLLTIALTLSLVHDMSGQIVGISAIARDITAMKRAHEQLGNRARQQAAVAEISQSALAGRDLGSLLDETVRKVAETLDVEFSKFQEWIPDRNELILRCGVGWKKGSVGNALVPGGSGSQAGFTLPLREPVVVRDLRREKRFEVPLLLAEHGIVSGVTVAVRAPDGEPYGVLGFHSRLEREFDQDDIHFLQSVANCLAVAISRKKAEDALVQAEQRLRESENQVRRQFEELNTIYATAPIGLVLVGPDFRYIRANAFVAAIHGLKVEEMVGHTVREVLGPLADKIEPIYREVFSSGRPQLNLEGQTVDQNSGQNRHWLLNYYPLLDESGEVCAVCGLVQEVTRLKESERALQERLDEVQTWFEISPIGLATANDPDCRSIQANRLLAEWLHLDPGANASVAASTGKPLPFRILKNGEEVSPEDLPMTVAARTAKVVTDVELELVYRDGRTRHVLAYAAPLFDPQGKVRGCIGALVDITERKKAGEAVRRSEEEYRAMFELTASGKTQADPRTGRLTRVNQKFCEISGYSESELLQLTLSEITHPSDRQAADDRFRQAVAGGGKMWVSEQRCLRKDGGVVWVSVVGSILRDDHGEPISTVATIHDVTAERRATEALQQSERKERERAAQLSAVLDATPSPIWIAHDPECHFVTGNRAAYETFGLPRGSNLSQTPPPNSQGVSLRHFSGGRELKPEEMPMQRSARLGGPILNQELVIVPPSGGEIHILGNAAPVFDADGHLHGVVAAFVDITERKLAEEALRRSEKQFRQLADAMPQIVWASRPDGAVDYYNRRWYDYTGLGQDRMGEAGWSPILHPDERDHVLASWSSSVQTGVPFQVECRFRDRIEGRYRWHLARALPIRDERGRIVRWFGTATDIDDLKRTQEALTQAEEKLRQHAEELEELVSERTVDLHQTVEALEGVAYTIAHDLRAPLRSLQGFSRILVDEYGDKFDDEGRDYARRIADAAARMDLLIADLLAFARLSHLEVPSDRVCLDELLRRLVHQLQPEISARHGRVVVEPLPEVVSNETILEQVFTNLLSNALKFVPADKNPEVRVWAEQHEGTIRLNVQDNGIGIALEHQDRVFGLFQRLHSEAAFPGTGVGLAIVRKGLDRLGGSAGVKSEAGRGSCFFIELPVR